MRREWEFEPYTDSPSHGGVIDEDGWAVAIDVPVEFGPLIASAPNLLHLLRQWDDVSAPGTSYLLDETRALLARLGDHGEGA